MQLIEDFNQRLGDCLVCLSIKSAIIEAAVEAAFLLSFSMKLKVQVDDLKLTINAG